MHTVQLVHTYVRATLALVSPISLMTAIYVLTIAVFAFLKYKLSNVRFVI